MARQLKYYLKWDDIPWTVSANCKSKPLGCSQASKLRLGNTNLEEDTRTLGNLIILANRLKEGPPKSEPLNIYVEDEHKSATSMGR